MELVKANLVDNPQNIVRHRITEYCFFYKKVFLHAMLIDEYLISIRTKHRVL